MYNIGYKNNEKNSEPLNQVGGSNSRYDFPRTMLTVYGIYKTGKLINSGIETGFDKIHDFLNRNSKPFEYIKPKVITIDPDTLGDPYIPLNTPIIVNNVRHTRVKVRKKDKIKKKVKRALNKITDIIL